MRYHEAIDQQAENWTPLLIIAQEQLQHGIHGFLAAQTRDGLLPVCGPPVDSRMNASWQASLLCQWFGCVKPQGDPYAVPSKLWGTGQTQSHISPESCSGLCHIRATIQIILQQLLLLHHGHASMYQQSKDNDSKTNNGFA